MYNKNVQFNAVSLFIEVMIEIWGKCDKGQKEFLLDKLQVLIGVHEFEPIHHKSDTYNNPTLDDYILGIYGGTKGVGKSTSQGRGFQARNKLRNNMVHATSLMPVKKEKDEDVK